MPTKRKRFHNLLNANKYVAQYTPEQYAKYIQEYRDSIGFGKDVTFGAENFDNYAKSMIKGYKDLAKKNDKGEVIPDDLQKALDKDNDSSNKVKNVIADALKPRDQFINAQKRYEESIAAFSELAKKVPEKYTVDDIRGLLVETQDKANKAIKAKHKTELEELKNNLTVGDVKAALNITDDAEATKARDKIIADVETSQKAQLGKFDKDTHATLNKLDKSAASEREDAGFTGLLESTTSQLSTANRNKMEAEIERAREANRKKLGIPESVNTELFVDVKQRKISAVKPEDLNFIISLTGREIKRETQTGEDGQKQSVWTVHMPHRIQAPWQYMNNKQYAKTDFLTMARAVKSSGHDIINIKLDFKDDATRKDRAREAYKAALETGFNPGEMKKGPPKKNGINMVDGKGQEIKPEDIFTPEELKVLHSTAAETRSRISALKHEEPVKPIEHTTNQMRGELIQLRNAARTAEVDLAKEKEEETEIERLAGGTNP